MEQESEDTHLRRELAILADYEQQLNTHKREINESLGRIQTQREALAKQLWTTFQPKYQYHVQRVHSGKYLYKGTPVTEFIRISRKWTPTTVADWEELMKLARSGPSAEKEQQGAIFAVINDKIIGQCGGSWVYLHVLHDLWFTNDESRIEQTIKEDQLLFQRIEDWLLLGEQELTFEI